MMSNKWGNTAAGGMHPKQAKKKCDAE